MQRISISIDDDLFERFDSYCSNKGYTNRSEGIRDAIRQLLAAEQTVGEDDDRPCVGCAIYVYDHEERELSSRLVKAQHHHHHIPAATLHLHLDPANCLEATVLRGSVKEVRDMGNRITSQTGVKHGLLHIIPTDGI